MARKGFPDEAPTTKVNYVAGHPTSLNVRTCRLVLLSDPSHPSFGFDKDRIAIGALDDNDIVLSDDTVSRHHCRVSQEDHGYLLTDLGSTNGTFVNDVRVREAYLTPGATLRVGKTELRFDASEEQLAVRPSARRRLGGLIGQTRRMREIFHIVERIAPTSATVVVEGETGTGKEVVAKTLHALSNRSRGPFIVVDCGAVPDNLIESELFGHEKGSFTGAVMTRRGLFEMANGGTIFLDELCELSLDLQPKLLRVLEQREVRRVGSNRPIRVDVRVVAATNRNLEEEVRARRFREDLFYRLSVVRVFLPPLRERREDIALLAEHFLAREGFNRTMDGSRRVTNIEAEALEALRNHAWPGNVRELINVLERACSFAQGSSVGLAELSGRLEASSGAPARSLFPGDSGGASSGAAPLGWQANPAQDRNLPYPGPTTSATPPVLTEPAATERSQPPTLPSLQSMTFKNAKEEWVASFERDYIQHLLVRNKGNISHAAREAEIDRKYFRKLMRKYGIAPGSSGEG